MKNSNNKQNSSMVFLIILIAACASVFVWNHFIDNASNLDVKIPESKNIIFSQESITPTTTSQIANEFENADGRPILLYLYATWCNICTENFQTMNEIAREFQNTNLKIIFLAIDRDIDEKQLEAYLSKFGNVYFQPQYLAFKDGFLEFLSKKNIKYNHRLPFTALLSQDDEVVTKFSGMKNKNYLRSKIIKTLFN